ncbi:MAG: LemA family protein [Candidatus Acidiferrales bacterium]|jgi:LemA protein
MGQDIMHYAIWGFLGGGLVLYGLILFNELIRLRNENDRAWSDIDVLLKQRNDEIPNLVAACQGYMRHEQSVFTTVAQARSAYMNAATVGQKAQADAMTSGALKTLFGVAESYPELKAIAVFVQLQKMIADLEERIADRREYFNAAVTTYNTRIRQLPEVFVAMPLGMKPRELFQATGAERQVTQVQFS